MNACMVTTSMSFHTQEHTSTIQEQAALLEAQATTIQQQASRIQELQVACSWWVGVMVLGMWYDAYVVLRLCTCCCVSIDQPSTRTNTQEEVGSHTAHATTMATQTQHLQAQIQHLQTQIQQQQQHAIKNTTCTTTAARGGTHTTVPHTPASKHATHVPRAARTAAPGQRHDTGQRSKGRAATQRPSSAVQVAQVVHDDDDLHVYNDNNKDNDVQETLAAKVKALEAQVCVFGCMYVCKGNVCVCPHVCLRMLHAIAITVVLTSSSLLVIIITRHHHHHHHHHQQQQQQQPSF